MNYLQVQDPFLSRAITEYLEQGKGLEFKVIADHAPVKITLTDNNLAQLMAEGHEVDSYALPLRLPVLLADLVWLMARRREDAEKSIPLNDDFILEPREFRLRCGDAECALTGREVALLQFMRETGECSKEELLSRVWRYHPESATHTVETHLWRLRQKLQQAGMTAPLIITTDSGYRIA